MSDSQDTNRAVRVASAVALITVGQLMASRAVRDGFFLTHFDATVLPSMMTVASIFSVVVVLGSTRLLRNVPPARTLPVFFAVSAALFAVEWGLSGPYPRAAAVLLYLQTMSTSAVVVSGFWSVLNERFDPHAAKKLIGRVAGAGSLGGVIGGVAVWLGAGVLDVRSMILAMAALNAVCVVLVMRIGGAAPGANSGNTDAENDEAPDSLWNIFRETPYLRYIAALVTLAAFTQAVYDYVFKTQAARHYQSSAELVSFFALFYLGISVVTFLVQNLMARRSLERFGLAITVSSLPGIGLMSGGLALLIPGLATAIGMRGGTGVVENSLFRSGYELLYTPVLPEKKRPTKTLIDVGGDKLGTAIGGGVAFVVLAIVPSVANPLLVCSGIAASLAGLVLMRRVHHGYVGSLTERLRVGSVDVSELPVVDATTQIAMSEAREFLARHAAAGDVDSQLAESSELVPGRTELIARRPSSSLRAPRTVASSPAPSPFVRSPRRELAPEEIDEPLLAIADLRSGERLRIAKALRENDPLPAMLVGHVIPLLADAAVADIAEVGLRRVAPVHTGAILDAALQSRTPISVRRRLCDLLGQLPTQRSADGLVVLLRDADFELRFRAASGLLEIRGSAPETQFPLEILFEVARTEAVDCRRRWQRRTALDRRVTAVPAQESVQGRRVIQGVTLIFTLLLVVLEREPLMLAIRALANHEGGDHGTGLEYLENVLPPQLLTALRPLLEEGTLAVGSARSRSAILAEIVGDASRDRPDIATLRRRIDEVRKR